jgi:hypothetical protein
MTAFVAGALFCVLGSALPVRSTGIAGGNPFTPVGDRSVASLDGGNLGIEVKNFRLRTDRAPFLNSTRYVLGPV